MSFPYDSSLATLNPPALPANLTVVSGTFATANVSGTNVLQAQPSNDAVYQLATNGQDNLNGNTRTFADADFLTTNTAGQQQLTIGRGITDSNNNNNSYLLSLFTGTTTNVNVVSLEAHASGNVTNLGTATSSVPLAANARYTMEVVTVTASGSTTITCYLGNKTNSTYMKPDGTWQSARIACFVATDASAHQVTGTGQGVWVLYANSGVPSFNIRELTYSDLSPTTLTVTGPAQLSTGVAATYNYVLDHAAPVGGLTIVPSETGFTATSGTNPIAIPFGSTSGSTTITATAGGSGTVGGTPSIALTVVPVSVTSASASSATSFTLTGPSSAYVTNASTSFSFTPNASYSGTITPSMAGLAGSWTPSSLTWSASNSPKTSVFTPSAVGSGSANGASSPSLTSPSSLPFTSQAQTLTVSPTNLSNSSTTPITFTGAGTSWLTSPPSISVTGVSGVSIGTITVVSNTSATATATTGSATGTLSFTDSTTSATATANVVAGVAYWSYIENLSGSQTPTFAVHDSSGNPVTPLSGGTPVSQGTGAFTSAFVAPAGQYVGVWTVGSSITLDIPRISSSAGSFTCVVGNVAPNVTPTFVLKDQSANPVTLTSGGTVVSQGSGVYSVSFNAPAGPYVGVWTASGATILDVPRSVAGSGAGSTPAATAYSVAGFPTSPVVGTSYPLVVVLNNPASTVFTATFGAATGLSWGGPVMIPVGGVSGTTTLKFTQTGSYAPSVTHTGGGPGITSDPTFPPVTATAPVATPASGYGLYFPPSTAGVASRGVAFLTGGATLTADLVIVPTAGITLPASITIPAGQSSAFFSFTANQPGTYSVTSTHTGPSGIADPSATSFVVSPVPASPINPSPGGLNPSGGTFAMLQSGGVSGQVGAVLAANPNLSRNTVALSQSAVMGGLDRNYQGISSYVQNFLWGDPVDVTDLASRINDYTGVYWVLAQAANEIHALILANPGTIRTIAYPSGLGPVTTRTFP